MKEVNFQNHLEERFCELTENEKMDTEAGEFLPQIIKNIVLSFYDNVFNR